MVLHWVDDNEHVSKVSWNDATSVVPGVFRPHNVHLIIAQVTQLPNKQNRPNEGPCKCMLFSLL